MQELGRGLKSPNDLANLSRELLKITVEASLNAEMDSHIGYEKHSPDGYNTGNSRNDYNRKTLKGEHGSIAIETPRDRNGRFEPVFVAKKHRVRPYILHPQGRKKSSRFCIVHFSGRAVGWAESCKMDSPLGNPPHCDRLSSALCVCGGLLRETSLRDYNFNSSPLIFGKSYKILII